MQAHTLPISEWRSNLRVSFNMEADKIQQFNQCLMQNKAVVAGSSVLSAYFADWEAGDMDIYVHAKYVASLYKSMQQVFGKLPSSKSSSDLVPLLTPAYDESFFRSNNLIGHCHCKFPAISKKLIDFIIVANNTQLINQEV